MASYRHLARIAIMQTLFAYEFRAGTTLPDLEVNCLEFSDKLKDLTFPKALLEGILVKKDRLLEVIQEEAPEWPIERIAPVDRAILEIGTYEILFSGDVPPIVAINEAVELAKAFGDTNSSKFVNGVLSSIMHKYHKISPDVVENSTKVETTITPSANSKVNSKKEIPVKSGSKKKVKKVKAAKSKTIKTTKKKAK